MLLRQLPEEFCWERLQYPSCENAMPERLRTLRHYSIHKNIVPPTLWPLLLLPQLLQIAIGLDGLRGEGVILPPVHKGGGHGQAGGHQLLHGGTLDGQHGLAAGAQHPDWSVPAPARSRACQGGGRNFNGYRS